MYTCLRKFVADAPNKEQECKDETVKKHMENGIKMIEGDLKNAGCSVPTDGNGFNPNIKLKIKCLEWYSENYDGCAKLLDTPDQNNKNAQCKVHGNV